MMLARMNTVARIRYLEDNKTLTSTFRVQAMVATALGKFLLSFHTVLWQAKL